MIEFSPALIDILPALVPELILAAAACVLFVGATFRADRSLWTAVALVALLAAGVALYYSPVQTAPTTDAIYHGALLADRLANLLRLISLAGGIVLVLLSWNEVPDKQAAEYYACLLLIIAGLNLSSAANELVTLFLALELISIPTYVLLYLPRHDRPAQEAAMKYFLLSIFSSGLLLFGFSYLYGLAGTTNLPALLEVLTLGGPERLPGMTQVALVMIVAALGFRISAVPFHFYAPDVYQGAPTVAAALLAFVPKVAGFAALIRLLGYVWGGHSGTGLALGVQAPMIFYIMAAVTMTLGNLLALLQDNLKRLLAYSSVAHAGYMLIGLAVAPYLRDSRTQGAGIDAVLFYLVSYGAMTVGAFAVLSYLSTPQRPVETVDDLAGLSLSRPGVAMVMALFLFSLIGLPPLPGFWGKFLLFSGALLAETPSVPAAPLDRPWLFKILALVGAINAAIGAWYYLRIVAVMYLRGSVRPPEATRSWPGLATLWICALVTLALIYPWPLVNVAHQAVSPPQLPEPVALLPTN